MTKLSPSEQESIVALLTRIYTDIAAIESEFSLMVGEGDFRPRIEYFHDAVRAICALDPSRPVSGGRLSVENLAYDVSALRYIQSKPLAEIKPNSTAQNFSARTDVLVRDKNLAPKPTRPDRAVRDRLAELYQSYAAMFSALLKPAADLDYHERVDSLNQDVEEIAHLIEQFDELQKGKGSAKAILAAIGHLEDQSLHLALMEFMKRNKYRNRDETKKAIQQLKQLVAKNDRTIAGIEKARTGYAMAQLAIYEESKDLLKKMAQQGLNLLGKFVENAIRDTQRELGR